MVGCVVVSGGCEIGSGWHQRFGGPHAEVHALSGLSIDAVRDATVYVTLEPCSHHGKTPPCLDLLARFHPRRVVIACSDPFPQVSGRGIEGLRSAGIHVDVGVLEIEARQLNAPYFKRVEQGLPWVIAKWAMTLDGAIATQSGDSKWITCEESRAAVHRLRARMDAILVGSETVLADNPLLTARPLAPSPNQSSSGPRVLTRVVVDRRFRIPIDCQLVQTAWQHPLCIVTESKALESHSGKCNQLQGMGAEILALPTESSERPLEWLLRLLGERGSTNVLVEGGGRMLGAMFNGGWVDQVECFIAPRILGGENARRPIQGKDPLWMNQTQNLERITWCECGSDIHIRGYVKRR
jgi:diaminohydroxyphosphoribosylaminopyrimidine deaminase/5-amino-6-(5-phosphoribosylamino)uracil reductase